MTFSFFAGAHLVTALTCFLVAWVCWHRRTIPSSLTLAFLMLAIGEWALGTAWDLASVGIPRKVFWTQVSYLGNATSPVLFFIFTLDYTRQTRWLTRRKIFLLLAFPLLIVLIAATNNWHYWLWSGYSLAPNGANIVVYEHGWFFWLFVAYAYVVLMAGVVVLAQAARRFRGVYRTQALLLLVSSLVPFAGNILYVFNVLPLPGMDWTPIAFAVSGWLLVVTIFRYHLLDLVPVARDVLVENMSDGVLVLDTHQRVVDVNPAAQHIFGGTEIRIGHPCEQVNRALAASDPAKETRTELVLGNGTAPQYIELSAVPFADQNQRLTGRLVIARDITQRQKMQRALEEMNTNLEHLVAGRTAELSRTVTELQNEIAERKRVEATLRQMENVLAQRVADQSRKLSALYELILFAGQSLSVEQIQEQALATIMSVMTADLGCIHQWDEKEQAQMLSAQRGLTPAMQAQLQTLPASWLLSERIPRALPDLATILDAPAAIHLPAVPSYLGAPTYLLNRPVGSISLFWTRARSFPVEDIALFSAMADQLGIIIENVRLRHRGEAAAALQERRRLARDLHDSVTQSLHSLVLVADTANNRLKQGKLDRLESSLAQLAESARQSLKEMRLLLYELRLANPNQVNLADALRLRLDTVEKRAGIDVQLIAENIAHIPKARENELYFIAMEALNNSLKYARATQVCVRLCGYADGVDLEIVDNGKGIDRASVRPGGLGLQNMQERAERLGGDLVIESAPGAGTRIYFSQREKP